MKIIFIVLFLFPLLFWGQKPKLVVGIVVDQMCYDYLYRFEHHFGKKGFHRFMNQGVNCRNTQYNYVPTFTGPGHASIFTGTTPYNHGIVANEWYDRNSKQGINCVFDAAVQSVGTINSKYGLASPHFLETMTLTDQLKFTYPSSKVFAISIKDRSAILPGGHLSDGSFWFDYSSGTFITSTYFANALPEWLQTFNQSKNADTYLKDWTLLHDSSTYSRTLDNSPYEITLKGKNSPTFPYNFTEFGRGNYSLFTYTPFANTLLTDLAIDCMQHEELGKGDSPDMLCISYSTPDIAGHAFGPYSMEVEDIYARLDRDIENLLKALDQQVGKENYLVFLTADHAVVPVPQQLKDQNLPGGYFDLAVLMKKLRSESLTKYGVDVCQAEENLNIYLNRPLIDSLHMNLGEIYQFLHADQAISSQRYSGFVQDQIALDQEGRWRLNAGIRFNHWTFSGETVWSPRVNLSWKPKWSKDWAFRLAVGRYAQPAFYRDARFPDGRLNREVRAQRATHWVLTADHRFKAWDRPFQWVIEGYYKDLTRLIPYEIDNVRIRYLASPPVEGYAAGLDLRIHGEFVSSLQSWATLSWMKTSERNEVIGWMPRPTDQRVQFAMMFQDYLPPYPDYKVSLNLVFGSRLPYGPPDFARPKDTLRMPPYRRVDIGFSRILWGAGTQKPLFQGRLTRAFRSAWMNLEVFNLLQINNTISYTWLYDTQGYQQNVPNYLSGRVLNLRLVLEW